MDFSLNLLTITEESRWIWFRAVKKETYNIAQNQSFVQKEIGEKPEYLYSSPPSNYCYIKPLVSLLSLF